MTDEQDVYGWRELTPVKWMGWTGPGELSMFPDLNQGGRVRARKRDDTEWREGVVTLIWLALEEAIMVRHDDDGSEVNYYVGCGLGDEMEVRVER
jgi:hypothetical protein